MTTWVDFSAGLPNCAVSDMEIYYDVANSGANKKLRAATFGRGTWDSDLYSSVAAPPVASFTANNTTVCAGQTVAFTSTSTGAPTSYSWTFTGGTPATSTAQNPTITYNTAGTYTVALTVTNANGNNTSTQTSYVTVTASSGQSLPFSEGFAGTTFPPTGWTLINVDANDTSWVRSPTVGFAPTAGNSMAFWNYLVNDVGNTDEMRTPKLNLSGYSAAQMTFDVAYAAYDATYMDGLEVLISTDCGTTWTSLYNKTGTTVAAGNLPTAAATTASFVPTTAQWRTETINLNSYLGQTSATLAFRNLAAYGNNLYIDNINITGTAVTTPPTASFTSTPTSTTCSGQTVQYTSTSTGTPTNYSWSFAGGTPATSTVQNPTVTYATAGTYNVSLTVSNAGGNNTSNQTNYITVAATPTVATTTPNSRCGNGTVALNATASAGTLSWFAAATGGTALGTGATFTTPSLTATTTYYVSTTANGCTSGRTAVIATVNPVPTVTSPGNKTACVGTAIPAISFTGTSTSSTYAWTNTNTAIGLAASGTGNIATFTPSAAGTSTVSVTPTLNGCPGSAVTFTIIVSAVPTLNSTTPASRCGTGTVALAATGSTGATLNWYAAATGGTSLGTGATFTTPSLSTTTTYYVEAVNGACSSTRTAVIATINAIPTVTNPGNQGVCIGSAVNAINFTGTSSATFDWTNTNTAIGLAASGTGNIATFTPAAAGTSTVSVTPTLNGCPGTAVTFTITASAVPTLNSTTPNSRCGTGTVALSATGSAGSTLSWYAAATGGTALGTGATFTTPSISTTTTYYVEAVNGGCGSGRTAVVATVNPSPTVTNPGNQGICIGSPVTAINFTGTSSATFDWTNSNTAIGLAASGSGNIATFTPTATGNSTVIVTPTLNDCAGSPVTFTISVGNLPTVALTNLNTVCDTDGSFALSGGTPAGGTYSGTGVTNNNFNPSTAGAGTYTITYTATQNGCSNTATNTIQVDACAGIDEVLSNLVVIYPNPTGGMLTVKDIPLDKVTEMELIDAAGRKVGTWKLTNSVFNVDLSNYSNGSYNLIFKGKDVQLLKRLEIKK